MHMLLLLLVCYTSTIRGTSLNLCLNRTTLCSNFGLRLPSHEHVQKAYVSSFFFHPCVTFPLIVGVYVVPLGFLAFVSCTPDFPYIDVQ